MYAVIKAGGKQHKVKPGDVIEIEVVRAQQGDGLTFTPLLVVDDDGATHFGKELGKAVVKGKILGEEKGDKVKVFKYRPKTGYAKAQGHRQRYTLVEIQDVAMGRTSRRGAAQTAERPKLEPDEGQEARRGEETRPAPAREVEGAEEGPPTEEDPRETAPADGASEEGDSNEVSESEA